MTKEVAANTGFGLIQALSPLQQRPRSRLAGRRRLAIRLPPEVARQGSYQLPRRLCFDSFRPYLDLWAFQSVAASGSR